MKLAVNDKRQPCAWAALCPSLTYPVRLLEAHAWQPVDGFKSGTPLGGTERAQTVRDTCDDITIPANVLGVVGTRRSFFQQAKTS